MSTPEIKKLESELADQQRKVPATIKEGNASELENLYEDIRKRVTKIYLLRKSLR